MHEPLRPARPTTVAVSAHRPTLPPAVTRYVHLGLESSGERRWPKQGKNFTWVSPPGGLYGPVDAGRSIKTRAARISSSQKFSRFAICPNVNNSHFNWNPCLFWMLLAVASKDISALDDILQVKGNTATNSACSIRFLQSLGVYTNLSGIRVHGRYPLTLTTQIIPVSM